MKASTPVNRGWPRQRPGPIAEVRAEQAAGATGGIGFGAFYWMIENGWDEANARNTLLLGAIAAFLIHVVCRSIPFMQDVLGREPVSPTRWLVVVALAVTVVPALELHKWSWRFRHRRSDRHDTTDTHGAPI